MNIKMMYAQFSSTRTFTDVLVCIDNGKVINWCEYDRFDFVGVFHNNSPIAPEAIESKTIYFIDETYAMNILREVADVLSETSHRRYAEEIKEFLYKRNEQLKEETNKWKEEIDSMTDEELAQYIWELDNYSPA